MHSIVTRRATKSDASYIALLGRVTFTETFGDLFSDPQDLRDYYNKTFSVEKIEKSIAKSNNVYWISFVDRLPVGYAKLKLHSPSSFMETPAVCQLQKIYVMKDFLSMKIGFQLQNLLLDKAKEKKRKVIWLSVLNENERAINFYLKSGYELIGNHEFRIGQERFDFTAMSKQLI